MSTAQPSSRFQASMSKKITRKAWLLILLCLPVICLAVYYTPFLASLGWHLMHGMAVNYRGLRVNVPLGWTADLTSTKDDFPANPQGITLEKQPKTLSFEVAGPDMMYFNLLLSDGRSTPSQQAAEWESLFRQSHPASDFDLSRRSDLSSDMDCLQATPRSSRLGAALACISLRNGWVAEYAGSQANVPVFLQVAGALKSKP
jgi:hypothetical protein